MKFIPFLMAMLVFLPSFCSALTYDLQPYTTCNNGLCSTSVDVTALGLNTARTNALKTVNITNFLTKSGIINNFAYSWNGNVLTLTGRVNDNVYWSFNGGSDVYDPWWNYTSGTTTAILNFSTGYSLGANPDGCGVKIAINQTGLMTINVTRKNGVTCPKAHIFLPNGNYYQNATFSGDNANFTQFAVSNGDIYYILADNDGSNCNSGGTTMSFPFNNSHITALKGSYRSGTTLNDDNVIRCVQNLTTQLSSTVNVYYVTNLYLNGTESNITMDNLTALSITAYNNLTLNSSIYINGTLKNNTVTNSTYMTFLPSGLYNITGYYFNASTNSSVTWWANMTYTVPTTPSSNATFTYNFDLNNAPLTCINSTHIQRNATVDNSLHQEIYSCPYGCDTVLNICKPNQFWTYIIFLVIIFAVIFGMYKVVSWL